jgi:hypothetical protein
MRLVTAFILKGNQVLNGMSSLKNQHKFACDQILELNHLALQKQTAMPVCTQSTTLTDNAYDLPSQNLAAVGPAFKVTKKFNKIPIELECSVEALAASMSGNGVWFQIRLDNKAPTYFSQGSLKSTELRDEVTAKSIYVGLPAGSYAGQIYAQAPNPGSSAKGIVIDPGGWGEKVLITEFET